MTIPAEHCEAKLHAFRKTQDGIVLSFTIHPHEIPKGVQLADLGTRYMLALAEIGDDEQPKPIVKHPVSISLTTEKPKREMTLPQIVGMYCSDELFNRYVCKELASHVAWYEAEESTAAEFVRRFCGVTSRSEIMPGTGAQRLWAELLKSYDDWQHA